MTCPPDNWTVDVEAFCATDFRTTSATDDETKVTCRRCIRMLQAAHFEDEEPRCGARGTLGTLVASIRDVTCSKCRVVYEGMVEDALSERVETEAVLQ